MEDRLDRIFREWHNWGGAVLVTETSHARLFRTPEELLAESTLYCRDSSRLTWVVVDWLIGHIEVIDDQVLMQLVKKKGDLAVLGLLCDAARQHNPHPKFQRILHACRPNRRLETFFHRVAQSPLASRLAQENALDIFRRWNYVSDELTYIGGSA